MKRKIEEEKSIKIAHISRLFNISEFKQPYPLVIYKFISPLGIFPKFSILLTTSSFVGVTVFIMLRPIVFRGQACWVGLGYFLHVEESPKPNF